MSRPRCATSVAISTRQRPDLKSASVLSRVLWSLSPWMAAAEICWYCSSRVKASAPRLVSAKTKTFSPPAATPRIQDINLSRFSYSPTTSTCWVMSAFAVNSSLPMVNLMGSSLQKSRAMRWISFGQVAENMTVCRSGLIWETILRICGSKPMSNMRSASSKQRYVTRLRFVTPASRKSSSRPGVAMTISTPRRRSAAWP
mmetsp:Transcript_66222/g.167843  ORF Transcript_66222/g.167843 Transcript_66222/m.167843 type:complete len:200 (+) Transcript_66222:493-1092(+)